MVVKLKGILELSDLGGALQSFVFGGASQYSTSAETELTIPQNLQIGYAYKPNDKFMWEVDVARFGWSDNQNLPISYGETNTTILSAINTGNPIPLKWRSTWNVATGINYKYTDNTAYRVGFWYEPHATNEAAFNPGILDLSRLAGTVGMGYNLTSNIRVDMAYNAIFFKQRNVAPTDFNGISGSYRNFVNLATIGFTFKFL
jgi:long-chain fatty acid transport protein